MPAVPTADEFSLEPRCVRTAFNAAAATFDSSATVHAEIRTRLLERLDVVRLTPAVVVDLGAGTGHSSRALKDRYRQAQVIAVDISDGMLQQAARQQRWLRRFHRLAGDAHALPLQDACADLLFSNLMLQWSTDPDLVLSETRRVLKPNSLLTFTTLGPDSLRELRSAWSGIDAHVHVHRFIDMHDLGDALLRAGFAEPVMDTERLTITYAGLDSLLKELRGSGSINLALGRPRGLSGADAGKRFKEACARQVRDDVWPLTLEVVYGHAWSAPPKSPRRAAGEARIPIAQIGRR